MGIKHEKQVHALISQAWMDRLDEIADAESLTRSELMRRVLIDFVRSYQADDLRLRQLRGPSKISGTGLVPDRYRKP